MPELPEVEVMRRDLEKEVVGKKIKSVEVTGTRSVRRHKNKKEFIALLEGHKIAGVQRRGKYLVFKLDGAEALVVHLGMSGQLLRAKSAREKAPKHTHVVIYFTQGGLLRFVDPRTFGEMFVTNFDDLEEQVEELAHLGLDPLETAMSWDLFGRMLAEKHARLKPLLMDQKFIAGIGNVYSDEILFQAGLKWDRMSDGLSQQEVRRLYRAIFETLQDAVKYRGSSLSDEQYVDLFGKPGEYQEHHQVYGRKASRAIGAGAPSTARATRTGRPSTATRARSDRTHPIHTRADDRDGPGAGCLVPGQLPRPGPH
jgi:formamidopyrimidine-DNA glycosylase